MDYKYYIGIDEVGRGPVAGPVTLCALVSFAGRNPGELAGIKDSKKLTEKGRERWFKKIKEAQMMGILDFKVFSADNKVIDKIGIVGAIRTALNKCLSGLAVNPAETMVVLDGSLKAPDIYVHQETIIKGDEKEAIIGAASVMAKVSRDWYMAGEIATKFPEYGFEKHKGYGTAAHYEAIKKHGLCDLHRRSFLK